MIPTLYYRIKDKMHHIGASWDKLAFNMDDVQDKAHEYINPEPKRTMKDNSLIATPEYVLAHYGESVNGRMRSNRPDETDMDIAEMLSIHTTDIDLILYRGVCEDVYNKMITNAKHFDDCDFFEKGFLATSLIKGHEIKYPTRLRIYVPAGSHVVYMGNVNDELNYYEVDIQHDAKLKIISIDETYINCRLIETA